jgi:NADH dehydrogenase
MTKRARVIIVGAGFAGLSAAKMLANQPVDVLLIDRNNYHTFTPLLYQVATCALDPSAVAYPVRSIIRGAANVQFLLGEVQMINHSAKSISVKTHAGMMQEERYDYLFIASGSRNHFGADPAIERKTFGLRDLDDALNIRNHVLRLFEKAIWTEDPDERRALMTFVVVGGGATGLETAGALHELYNSVLDREYDTHDRISAQVILIELAGQVLAPYPEKLRISAEQQLRSLGVEVRTGIGVQQVGDGLIVLQDGSEIRTHTVIWATGVLGSPLASMLGVELQRGGRVPVDSTLLVCGYQDVFVAGDLAYLLNPVSGEPYPGMIPVAQQQGKLVAQNILRLIRGDTLQEFRYFDRGIMATIGRQRAVAYVFNRISLTGFVAWLAWLGLHLVALLGMRNRVHVFLNWVWDYLFYDRSVRIIVNTAKRKDRELMLEAANQETR